MSYRVIARSKRLYDTNKYFLIIPFNNGKELYRIKVRLKYPYLFYYNHNVASRNV